MKKGIRWIVLAVIAVVFTAVVFLAWEQSKESKKAESESYASLDAEANNTQSFYNEGLKEEGQENWSAALTYFQKATVENPDDADAWLRVAYCYDKLGRYQDAIESYKQAIRINPGKAYARLDRWQDAIEAYKQVIRIKPNDAEAHCNLGVAYAKLARWQDAVESFKQAIRIEPDYAEAHHILGIVYTRLDRWQDAIEAYKQAIRIEPDDAEAHYNLGVAYGKLGRHQDAVEAFKQAIRIKPDDANARYNLGVAYAKLGRLQETKEEQQALRYVDEQQRRMDAQNTKEGYRSMKSNGMVDFQRPNFSSEEEYEKFMRAQRITEDLRKRIIAKRNEEQGLVLGYTREQQERLKYLNKAEDAVIANPNLSARQVKEAVGRIRAQRHTILPSYVPKPPTPQEELSP